MKNDQDSPDNLDAILSKMAEELDYPGYLDGIESESFDEEDEDAAQAKQSLLERIKKLPPQVSVATVIDNNEHINYVQSEKPMKQEPDVGDYILMVHGKITHIGNHSEVLEKTKDLLYGDEIKMTDLVVLKRINIKAGVYFGD